ncbi:MAG TPA: hypothetical protein VFH61_16255 [Thermoleophilia bacterium]|nr:hypothetical protein [Thermoleophilia bacterium]
MLRTFVKLSVVLAVILSLAVAGSALAAKGGGGGGKPDNPGGGGGGGGGGNKPENPGGGGGKPDIEATNNLSFPVIWGDEIAKAVPGTADEISSLDGVWWYWWGIVGTDPNTTFIDSALPDPDDTDPGVPYYTDDGVEDSMTTFAPADDPDLIRAYVQKDAYNVWQAESGTPEEMGCAVTEGKFAVNWIDWGDDLESVDWKVKSKVRTEVVLFQDNPTTEPWLEYDMRHVDGWGITELWGLAAGLNGIPLPAAAGVQATVYTPKARLTIQKLVGTPTGLTWHPDTHYWTDADVTQSLPIKDAPYGSEVNVKGRIMYGFTWDVRSLNDMTGGTAAGVYRVTFSLDGIAGDTRQVCFEPNVTHIMVPDEEDDTGEVTLSEAPGGGGTAVLDYTNDITWIDVNITE